MKRAYQLAHVLFPLLFALASLFMSLRREPLSGELLVTHLAWGFLFYAAPHFLWAVLSAVLRPSLVVWHSGFVASSCSLLLVAALSVWGPRDPSGLPYWWFVYWPLSGLLLVVILICWFSAGRPHANT
jgi:hypothetical protein